MSDPSQARFLRALVRSASIDGPAPGARARARVRLGVTDAATTPLGFVGVVLLAALLVATGLRSGSGVAAVLVIDSSAECQGGIETPPAACNSPPISRQQAVSGSSSGTDLARGSSGG